ncbi:MAG: ice-binding family protein [Thermoplasmata archaeon]
MYRNLTAPLIVVVAVALVLISTGVGLTQGATDAPASVSLATTNSNASPTGATALASDSTASTCGQSIILLGAAAHFSVLAGTTVTNTGATVVHGNLGVSPGTAVTGFPPGKVTGTTDVANTAAAKAQTALLAAYNNGMGRTNCPVAVAGNIGGQTLGPGLYRSTSSLAISSGDLTLAAHGHSSAVFVFQVTSKFTVTSGRHVILAGGALASHIFWVVGSSATLGTTSVVYGNILAHKSISLATGAILHGKALAHIGAVTLAGNTITLVAGPSLTPSAGPALYASTALAARPTMD